MQIVLQGTSYVQFICTTNTDAKGGTSQLPAFQQCNEMQYERDFGNAQERLPSSSVDGCQGVLLVKRMANNGQ